MAYGTATIWHCSLPYSQCSSVDPAVDHLATTVVATADAGTLALVIHLFFILSWSSCRFTMAPRYMQRHSLIGPGYSIQFVFDADVSKPPWW